jgi:hypothetical protein
VCFVDVETYDEQLFALSPGLSSPLSRPLSRRDRGGFSLPSPFGRRVGEEGSREEFYKPLPTLKGITLALPVSPKNKP